MQQRPSRAVDQGRRLLEFKLLYVSFTQVELDSLLNCAHSSLREHRRELASRNGRALHDWSSSYPHLRGQRMLELARL